ncbi:MAG: M20/M25/M40 family metallo-hydrolase [Muribaculaceae bacterium]|nr:M20/M25/M40 family metallo-hydrolase [Muribaculaceae bacterium]
MKGTLEENYFQEAVSLLQHLISVPSFSNEEGEAADIWEKWLRDHGVKARRFHNNVYALSEHFDSQKPVLLLNSHLDTVKPVSSYTRNPFEPSIEDGRIYGLGSNDAGGAGVTLAATFLRFKDCSDLPFNLILAITASEERMGELGMRAFLPHLEEQGLYPAMAIVGEPTECKAAIAERGLVVCDVTVKGEAGHAARNEGINAIYRALEDITLLRNISFPKESTVLGPIKVSVTMIQSGTQHNVVPDHCSYVADIRTTDAYTNEETVKLLEEATSWSSFSPRSTRIQASVLSSDHPLTLAAIEMGLDTYVSPTTSDMALMHSIPSIKIGPGKSERSHTADEFIELEEIRLGMEIYETYLKTLSQILSTKD